MLRSVEAAIRATCSIGGSRLLFDLPVNGKRGRFTENEGRILELRSVIDKATIGAQI